ncbi:hypothetical protein C5167_017400 [Papaver somniferum]|uniref:Uncharacterized protein n=1 Tax=Papaver somniferum TaxID=3469 RepID=A0A4Y7INC1_PAPSO|nr:hypothetical protein C5167_017400 [Papaver somniferum]
MVETRRQSSRNSKKQKVESTSNISKKSVTEIHKSPKAVTGKHTIYCVDLLDLCDFQYMQSAKEVSKKCRMSILY